MADEPTLGEIKRRVEMGFSDLKEDLRELGHRLDSKVSMERYTLEQLNRDEAHKQLVERVKGLEDAAAARAKERDEAAKERERTRQQDRRLIFTALVAPVLMVLLTVYLQVKGA